MTSLLLRSGPVGLLLALAFIPATGHATGSPDSSPASSGRRVLLVTPEPDGDIAPAVVTRLRGELRAARFEMEVATISADAPRRATVEEMAAREGTAAALGIFFGGGRVEMWATDASAGRTLMENLRLDAGAPERRATIVAVKAVDLLKATLAEIWTAPSTPAVAEHPPEPLETIVAPPPPPPPPVVIEHPDEDATTRSADRFSLTVGGGWMQADGMSGWAPMIAVSAALGGSGLALRLTGSALGSSTDVTQTAGSAQLSQQLVLAELMFWSPVWHRLRAALALGIGEHHLSIDGTGAPGFSGVNSSAWSTATSAGVSVSWSLPAQLLLALDARAVENWTSTSVQIHGTEVARIGRPIVWVALAAGVRFR